MTPCGAWRALHALAAWMCLLLCLGMAALASPDVTAGKDFGSSASPAFPLADDGSAAVRGAFQSAAGENPKHLNARGLERVHHAPGDSTRAAQHAGVHPARSVGGDAPRLRLARLEPTLALVLGVIALSVLIGQTTRTLSLGTYLIVFAGMSVLTAVALIWLYLFRVE